MPKISALPPMTTADAADEAPIVDTSVTTTKKWTLTLLKTYLQSLTAWVTSTMISGLDKSLMTTDSNPYKASVYRNAAQNAGNNAFAHFIKTALHLGGELNPLMPLAHQAQGLFSWQPAIILRCLCIQAMVKLCLLA